MDLDEFSLLKQTNIEQGKKIEVLEQTIKKLTEPAGPRHVKASELNDRMVDPRDIAEGKVVVDFEEPEPVTLKPNQLSRSNTAAINANLARIASGEIEVV